MTDIFEQYENDLFEKYNKVRILEETEQRTKYLVRERETDTLRVIEILPRGNVKVYNKLSKSENFNLLKIVSVHELPESQLAVVEEYIEGAQTFQDKVDSGIKAGEFEDYILQIYDVLVYLNTLKNPIAHKNICSDNILIDTEDVVKLTGFEQAEFNGNPETEIKTYGKLIQNAGSAYKKKYRQLIDDCLNLNITLVDIRKGIYSAKRVLGMQRAAFIMIIALIMIILRVIWTFTRIGNRFLR